ncbi:DUF4403 family protein [Shivajiella indica]|uniref:DUF4403 family protein n=1 Tax=Shivajiella indica TaxID=872115 RepID=A0ABW5B515_9BACT
MSSKYPLFLIFFILILGSCKSIKPENPPAPTNQDVFSAKSIINVPISIPLSLFEENLNENWNSQLFSDKALNLGSGLFADLDVNRTGKISLRALGNNSLQVKIPMNLKGDLKIEKKVFGQVLSTSIPFNENISPEISFVPEIGKNWDLVVKNLNIDNWGRSLKYNLLGFEIDLDPIVRGQLHNVLDKQLSLSNLSRLDFKNMAQETWNAFSEPYSLEFGEVQVHFYAVPTRLKVRDKVSIDQKLNLYLGIEGEMHSKVGAKPQLKPVPLPDIEDNENEDNVLDIVLPLTLRYEDLDVQLNKAISGQNIRADKNTVLIPDNLKTQQYGDKILLGMDFKAIRNEKKEVKGKIFFAGMPVFDRDSESLKFDNVEFDVKTSDFLARWGIKSKRRKIQKQIEKLAIIPLGGFLKGASSELAHQGYLETGFATFKVVNPNLVVEDITNTAETIQIFLRAKGEMDVQLKSLK